MYSTMLERFVRYAKTNTRSDINFKDLVPTTVGQRDFLLTLKKELIDLGLEQVQYDARDAFVVGCLPSNLPTGLTAPAIGFIAHVDTADYPSENIQPQIWPNYDGDDLILNEDLEIVMRVAEFPNLVNYKGQTLITTDGTTLLGADDKAGITAILEAVSYLKECPSIFHGDIWIAFGPDEEIGLGAYRFETDKFPVEFAYTVDGGAVGQLDGETFNAAKATISIQGTSVHPGEAKNLMVNPFTEAVKFHNRMPQDETPECTSGDEGYYMLTRIEGDLEQVRLHYNIRDFDKEQFEQRKMFVRQLVNAQNETYLYPRLTIEMEDQYYNMKEILDQNPQAMKVAIDAYKSQGIEPIIQPFRGGTDGCIISYKGIPTPNIFTGAENLHGCYEFVSLESMQRAADVIVEITQQVVRHV